MNISGIEITKVSNGYIVRDDKRRGDFVCNELAVFNDVNGLCDWIKANFQLEPATPAAGE